MTNEASTDTITDTLVALREALAEARRYILSDPEGTAAELKRIGNAILNAGADCESRALERVAWNLHVAARYLRTDPGACRGYIDGARLELAVAIARRERAAEWAAERAADPPR